jgi:hypothetical protein
MTWLSVTRRPLGPIQRFWALFPAFRIAQISFQVIGKCGVISPVRRSNARNGKTYNSDCPRLRL